MSVHDVSLVFPLIIASSMVRVWKLNNPSQEVSTRVFTLERNMVQFTQKYDEIQGQLEKIAAMDDLLAGALGHFSSLASTVFA